MGLRDIIGMYNAVEKRNITIYIIGIMFYKFGLEAFNGSISTLAQDRFKANNTFTKWGALTGLNQAMQCVGSIAIAPLVRKYPTRGVLAAAIMIFGLLTAILLVVDAATGGKIKSGGVVHYGDYTPDALFPIYMSTGIAYGMVELIRRIIPRDIVGGHVGKLKRMDATVHIFYEVAGTAGAFASAALITRLGNNYAFIVTPIFFTLAAITWSFISALDFKKETKLEAGASPNYFSQLMHGFLHFGQAVWTGAKIITSSRRYIWLVPGYSFALYGHRYLENGLGPAFSKRVLGVSTYSQIIVGGSNFGELLGALTVFITANSIPTPIPFIRLDALLLNIVWYLGFYYPPPKQGQYAWRVAASFIPISFGWAAGDVSLAAYIQSSLARVESSVSNVSALGAVMSLLYVVYIVINAILSAVLGKYIDSEFTKKNDIHHALKMIGGVQFTVLCVIMLLSTLIPKGALAFNPPLLDDQKLDEELPVIKEPKDAGDQTDSTEAKPTRDELAHSERRSAEVEMYLPG